MLGTIPLVKIHVSMTAACRRLQMTARAAVSCMGENPAL
jgi:hypothetical protein